MKLIMSFVVPIYKVPQRLLRNCIDSLVNQTEPDYEVLLIDDGSEDECCEICDDYTMKYSNVRCIHQRNKGLAGARNTGIANACGEWISFVDADDYVANNTVEILKAYLLTADTSLDILFWDGYSVNNVTKTELDFFDGVAPDSIKKSIVVAALDLMLPTRLTRKEIKKSACIGVAWAKAFRMSFLVENQLLFPADVRLGEDSIFFVSAVMSARKIEYMREHLYCYVINGKSLSRGYNSSAVQIFQRANCHYVEIKRKCTEIPDITQRLNVYIMRLIIQCLRIYYLHPANKKKCREVRKDIKRDMNESMFKEAIYGVRLFGNDIRFVVIVVILRLHCYELLMLARAALKLRMAMVALVHKTRKM